MQISSIQYNTAAAAASPLQAIKGATASGDSAAPTPSPGVEHVEKGQESEDRDANEIYHRTGRRKGEEQAEDENSQPDHPSLLSLEVSDPDQPSTLDLQG